MKGVKKFAKFVVVFAVIFSWVFGGWPQFSNFPPKVQVAQAAIAFRSAGTVVNPAPGAANITLTAPAGVVATDIVLAVIYESAAGSGLTITPPAGWTLSVSTSDTVQTQSVYWALGNVASYVFSMTGNLDTIGFTLAYTGVNNTTPMDAAAVGQLNAASVTVTAPSITTVSANTTLVGFFGIITQSTFTSALTIRQQGNGPFQDTNPKGLAAADVVQAAAGASGVQTATASVSGANLGQLVALRPAAAAPAQTLTFSVSQSSAGFSTLSTSASTYANAAGTGSATEVEAHTLTASTNASGGYKITVQGATLTSGVNTIAAIGGTSAAPSPGTPQFGLRINVTSGTGTATSPYGTAGQFAYAADASTASQVASGAGDGSSTVFSVRYLANISPVTPAGSYSTTLTYVATGTF